MPYILALDEGTSSARAALYDHEGRAIGMESEPVPAGYPRPGWVQQDAFQIWAAQLAAVRRLLEETRTGAREIAAIGITNQRETVVVWDRATGQPIAPAISWQCRRTADYCREVAAGAGAALITARTGLVVDAYFSASKIRWILENTPGARCRAESGELLFGTIDTWLVWQLTNGQAHVTDVTNASRTMLMDLAAGAWDDAMLARFGIPRPMLPRIVPSSSIAGYTEAFGSAIPVAGIAGDQQAALAGQACFREGLAKNTYGTGCFALLHTGRAEPRSHHRLLATRAASLDHEPRYAIEGSVFIAGAAVQWLRDQMGLLAAAAESEAVARSVSDTAGVYFVPAFVGLGAPHWNPAARGTITGITRATSGAHIVRAALESIAYQTRELIEAMEQDCGRPLEELRADGGAAVNDFLMQFQADILDRPVVRPADVETTALGAAFLAGLATGFWKTRGEIESFWRAERRFEPRMAASVRAALIDGWRDAVARAR
jgi:glycerol kinase